MARDLYGQRYSRQGHVPVGRPTFLNPAILHDRETMRVSEGKLLVMEFLHNHTRGFQFLRTEGLDEEVRQCLYESKELDCALLIVAA